MNPLHLPRHRPRNLLASLLIALGGLLASGASHGACESPYAASPQFVDCGFRNPPNPDALPSASPWRIWPRFLAEPKSGTVPADCVTEFDWWQTGQHDGVQVTATPAQHFSGRTLNDRDKTLWASWVIESGDQRIFYSGDSGYSKGFAQIGERFGGFDLAMIE